MANARSSPPELLAPGGDWEALRAAVANGADAVYFGLSEFNARFRAANFTIDELPAVMKYLHDRNVRGYVAFNTLIFSSELPQAARCLKTMAHAGVDAVIVQDFGLVRLIKRLAPDLPIHGSTQMTLTEPKGIDFARRLGIERVILARELSLAEIKVVAAQTEVPLEVFVHGALCVAYSGQCLTSEALGGRSANRGQCAQACRMPYEMISDGKLIELGDRAYLLSPQDLAAYDRVADLAELGVACLKIEGRLKAAPYVAVTTQTYRAAIEHARDRAPFLLSDQGRHDLEVSFSRGLTNGFLDGVNHQKLVAGRFPKSRGIAIGTVIESTRKGVLIEVTSNLPRVVKPGDGIVFDEGRPEEKETGGRVFEVRMPHGQNSVVELTFREGALSAPIAPGARVWKTHDPALQKKLEATWANDPIFRKTPLDVVVSGKVGGPLEISYSTEFGQTVKTYWPGPLAIAEKMPVSEEVLREQLGRLGDTPFVLRSLDCRLPDGVMIPKSILNQLRRQAIQELLDLRNRTPTIESNEALILENLRNEIKRLGSIQDSQCCFSVLVRTLEQLEAVLNWNPETPLPKPALIYCDFEDVRRYKGAVARAKDAGVPIGLATLRIVKPGEEAWLRMVAECTPDVVLVRNLAALAYFQEHGSRVLVGDYSLNIANELTADLFMRQGLMRLVPSYDLTWEQLAEMVRRLDPGLFEIVIHQHMPMFHMEHCVFAAFLSNGKDHRDCGRPCDHHRVELRDRTGAEFPVVADAGCRNTVFNSVAQSAAEFLPRMQALGLSHFRVELLREPPDQVAPLLEQYLRVLVGLENGRTIWRRLQALNQLGVTRGTLELRMKN